jgi:hypothetical protein
MKQLTITATTCTFTKAHAIVLPNSGWSTNTHILFFLSIKRGILLSIVFPLENPMTYRLNNKKNSLIATTATLLI